MNSFFKFLIAAVLFGCVYNMFKTESTGSVDGIQRDFCKDRKCNVCDGHIGCYGYDYSHSAGLVIGPDNSLHKCRSCSEKRL